MNKLKKGLIVLAVQIAAATVFETGMRALAAHNHEKLEEEDVLAFTAFGFLIGGAVAGALV